jgi:hypothetical protein
MNKNSWSLSLETETGYSHHYFCKCGHAFGLFTDSEISLAPDLFCPHCENNYFIDTQEWELGTKTKIWKQFFWEHELRSDDLVWSVILFFTLPRVKDEKIVLERQNIFTVSFEKSYVNTSTKSITHDYSYPILSQYKLFLNDNVTKFYKLMVQEAKELLFANIMSHKTEAISWLDERKMAHYPLRKKLDLVEYFIKHPHLQELELFEWKMPHLHHHTRAHPSQEAMLHFIRGEKQEKTLKKALYSNYLAALGSQGYHPYSDFVFARSIDDANFLRELLSIAPAIKEHIFNDENFAHALRFINFLKLHYSEKQITRLFVEEMQDLKHYKRAVLNWRDTLRMLSPQNSFESLERYFHKVKLTTKALHDELIRVFNLASFEDQTNSLFTYAPHQLAAQTLNSELRFVLPEDVFELSLWAKTLHNCMFGYVRQIKNGHSLIYGVFKEDALTYAIELRGTKIIQAHGTFNKRIHDEDMQIIDNWHQESYMKAFAHER